MSFIELNLKEEYDSDIDNILNDFYIPVLSQSVQYYRMAGFFSSSALAAYSKGISELIRNDGKMKLLCSRKLSEKDYSEMKKAKMNPIEYIENSFIKDLDNIDNDFIKNQIEGLGWMIANNLLEIKIAIPDNDIDSSIFHNKIGIFIDEEENIVSFIGSMNESQMGLMYSTEAIDLYFSWDPKVEKRAKSKLRRFNEYWNHNTNNTTVIELSDFIKQKLIDFAPHEKADLKLIKENKKNKKKINPRPYQNDAVNNWINNNYKGILNMATGTGKTITALSCYDILKKKSNDNFLTIIACPQQHLLTQWKDNIRKFFNCKILSTVDSKNWGEELDFISANAQRGDDKFPIVLTTHKTFSTEKFLKKMKKRHVDIFLIVDEVHGVGASTFQNGLYDKYRYRLGLSATPERFFDDDGTETIYKYFDKSVYEFTLDEAIEKGFLTPYEYCPHFVELTYDEKEEYLKLTKEIAIIYENNKNFEDLTLTNKYIERQSLIDHAKLKYETLNEILDKLNKKNHLLVYCSHKPSKYPKQTKQVEKILKNRNISPDFFTGSEPKDTRMELLKMFEKNENVDALIAMKCLDEGVDVPSAEIAIFMASTSNPREFIQRRGRILRKSPKKEKAVIHDLIVLPSLKNLTKSERNIIDKELSRYKEFMNSSTPKSYAHCNKLLMEWMDIYGE